MQLFYNPEINSSNQEFTFDKTESRHIVRVLRKKGGDTILITNGLGTLFTSKIIIANDKRCLVKITNIEAKTKTIIKSIENRFINPPKKIVNNIVFFIIF